MGRIGRRVVAERWRYFLFFFVFGFLGYSLEKLFCVVGTRQKGVEYFPYFCGWNLFNMHRMVVRRIMTMMLMMIYNLPRGLKQFRQTSRPNPECLLTKSSSTTT